MSEYMEKHSVSRLIGAPPGYVGYEEGGQLTEAVRRRPYNVVLLDEIEKAHPEVLNILLQLMDEGRLTDSQGRTVSFTNVVLVLTSNIGQEHLISAFKSSGGISQEKLREKVTTALQAHFRPEFLNRLDDIVIFHMLSQSDLFNICELMAADITKRLEQRNIKLVLDKSASKIFINEAYDPQYGARPLRRCLEKKIVTELSRLMLDHHHLSDNSLVTISSTAVPPAAGAEVYDRGQFRYAITPLPIGNDSMDI